MSPPKPTIILVAGAWHTDYHLQPILPVLTARGYTTIPLSLASAGLSEPRATFADDVAKIQKAIENATATPGARVSVIAHSAAGKPSTVAISNFLDAHAGNADVRARLTDLVFLASFLNTERVGAAAASWFGYDAEKHALTAARSEHHFYNDMEAAASKPFVDALVLHTPVVPPEEMPSAWREAATVRRSYVVCLRDMSFPVEIQRLEAQESGMRVVELNTGHCPFVSAPEVFAECVEGVLKR